MKRVLVWNKVFEVVAVMENNKHELEGDLTDILIHPGTSGKRASDNQRVAYTTRFRHQCKQLIWIVDFFHLLRSVTGIMYGANRRLKHSKWLSSEVAAI